MTTNSSNPVDGDVLQELRKRYSEPKIPSCRICGSELSVQSAGGGEPTIWGCSGHIDDPTGERNWIYAEGRSCADEHYERSRWTDYKRGGDSDVIDLIDAYRALLDERLNATAQPVSDGWVKCSERYPDVGQEVLIRIPVCEKFNIENARYSGYEQFIGAWCSVRGKGHSYTVTHWMPLPAAPGGQDD